MPSSIGRSDIVLKAKRPQDIHVVIEFKQGEAVERLSKKPWRRYTKTNIM